MWIFVSNATKCYRNESFAFLASCSTPSFLLTSLRIDSHLSLFSSIHDVWVHVGTLWFIRSQLLIIQMSWFCIFEKGVARTVWSFIKMILFLSSLEEKLQRCLIHISKFWFHRHQIWVVQDPVAARIEYWGDFVALHITSAIWISAIFCICYLRCLP